MNDCYVGTPDTDVTLHVTALVVMLERTQLLTGMMHAVEDW